MPSVHPLRDGSSVAGPRDVFPLPARSTELALRSLDSVDPTNPTDRDGGGSPTAPSESTAVAVVPFLSTTSSYNAVHHSELPLAIGSSPGCVLHHEIQNVPCVLAIGLLL